MFRVITPPPVEPTLTSQHLATGFVVLLTAFIAAWFVRQSLAKIIRWHGRGPSSATFFSKLASWAVILIGFGVAVTTVFPSIRAVDLLGGLGIVSLAAGIAFQTVLGNLFAGVVVLARDEFRNGDHIEVQDVNGIVESIDLSSTSVRTLCGRVVVIPNSVLHSEVVRVHTGSAVVRSHIHLEVPVEHIGHRVAALARNAAAKVSAVVAEPEPVAVFEQVTNGTGILRVTFWTATAPDVMRTATHEVLCAVVAACGEEEIDLNSAVQWVDLRGNVEPRNAQQ